MKNKRKKKGRQPQLKDRVMFLVNAHVKNLPGFKNHTVGTVVAVSRGQVEIKTARATYIKPAEEVIIV